MRQRPAQRSPRRGSTLSRLFPCAMSTKKYARLRVSILLNRERRNGETMTQPFLPLGTPEEFQALRDVKVGRTIALAMQERLTLLKLAEHKLGGLTLTNAGEVRLAQERAPRTGAFPRKMFKR